MNIETLHHYTLLFSREIVESGFKRDLEDYIASLPSAQSNILALREIATKLLAAIDRIYSGDLPAALSALLPTSKVRPFMESSHNTELSSLLGDSEITQQEFFVDLSNILNTLHSDVQTNADELAKIEDFIAPYMEADVSTLIEADEAIVSIIFSHADTITSLRRFTSTIAQWNKTLPVYHQLLCSSSPEDIRIREVQNGSIDLIVNLDVDVAVNLAEIFKIGFQVFVAYLSYKKMIKPIIDSYHGNKKLISSEESRETLLLENIGDAVRTAISDQHRKAKKHDQKVDATAIPKKVDLVAKLVTAHIVQGNDFIILGLPEKTDRAEDDREAAQLLSDELRATSTQARRSLREIPTEAHQKLLHAYGKSSDGEPDNEIA